MTTSYSGSGQQPPHPTLLGLVLSTNRLGEGLGPDAPAYFPFEPAIAAISVAFFRTTVRILPKQPEGQPEPAWVRWAFALALAALAYARQPYEVVAAFEIFSYAVPYLWRRSAPPHRDGTAAKAIGAAGRELLRASAAGAVLSLAVARLAASGLLSRCLWALTPPPLARFLRYMFPVDELADAYGIMARFASDPQVLRRQVSHLLFVTFHIQVGMGFLGIDFLRQEQGRRNELVRMDVVDSASEAEAPGAKQTANGASRGASSNGSVNGPAGERGGGGKGGAREVRLERARRFQRTAPAFILRTALPYMFQIIAYGNVNKFAFMCVQHDLHRSVRHDRLFERDNRLMAMAADSATSPEAYATSMGKVLDISYEIWNRKLFSLPKILLLPGVISRQPMLVVQVFPVIFASDWVKATVMSAMTRTVEGLERQLQDLRAVRSKVESFDIKNAELLQRSGRGAIRFTQRRWEGLTVQVQARIVVSDLINRSKLFFSFIQRNFVFSVLIDCALANLIAVGKIGSAETFVFSRAIEDTVDMLLMRSRAEAELARMGTEIGKLEQLAGAWERGERRALLHCHLAGPAPSGEKDTVPPYSLPPAVAAHHRARSAVVLRNLVYSRGTAHVRADHIELDPGVYALTGSNGSGKSTLFRILMSCHTNDKPIDLPPSINLLTPMEPLCEEDDIRREITCEVDDDGDEEAGVVEDEAGLPTAAEAAIEVGSLGELSAAAPGAASASASARRRDLAGPPPAPHPRLSITMPSPHVVEISQSFYWPLYARPIDWIYQEDAMEELPPDQLERRARRVAEELKSLEFFRSAPTADDADAEADPEEAMTRRIVSELLEVKEDWFSDLSGGQKSKVELVRKVFVHDRCPDVLLIDETLAPLDPSSKSLVMGRLRGFCSRSVVIVIYHTDVGRETAAAAAAGEEGGTPVECVPSNDFFSKNIHLEAGVVHVRSVC